MKKLLLMMVIAGLLTAAAVMSWRPMPIEERVVRAEAARIYPELAATLQAEPAEVSAVLLEYADDPVLMLKAQAALLARPALARRILPLYGPEPEFREILRAYGDAVLLPIDYFLDHDVRSLGIMSYVGERYEQVRGAFVRWWNDRGAAADSAQEVATAAGGRELDAEARGWYAIHFIRAEGHDFLGQFVADGAGQTRWVQTERVLEGINSLFAGGVRGLETKLRTDQTVGAGDVGWAAVDVVIVSGAVKLLRTGRAAARVGQASTAGQATAAGRAGALGSRLAAVGRAGLVGARYAKWPAAVGMGYLVLRNPALISDVLAGVAEAAGLPVVPVQVAGWMLLLLPLLYVLSWLAKLLALPVRLAARLRTPKRSQMSSHRASALG